MLNAASEAAPFDLCLGTELHHKGALGWHRAQCIG
jgi:hypothetical protein